MGKATGEVFNFWNDCHCTFPRRSDRFTGRRKQARRSFADRVLHKMDRVHARFIFTRSRHAPWSPKLSENSSAQSIKAQCPHTAGV